MLVHRIVVVHVELHHREDAPELRHEPAQNLGFVQAAQGVFGMCTVAEDFQEQRVRHRVGAHGVVDQIQALRNQAQRNRMDQRFGSGGFVEKAQNVDRILFKNRVIANGQAPALDGEWFVGRRGSEAECL